MTTYADFIWQMFESMQGEIAREIRVLLGQEQYDQRIFTDKERERRVEAMKECARKSSDTAEARHKAWCDMHFESGWKLGPEFRPDIKEHPNLVPWDQPPADARHKAQIFDIVSRHAAAIIESASGPQLLRASILARFPISTRATALALTKLDELEMWLERAGQEAK